jgi:VanZ family protein
MNKTCTNYILIIIVLTGIALDYFLCLKENSGSEQLLPHFDKFCHFFIYFILTSFFINLFKSKYRYLCLAVSVSIGVHIEFLQKFYTETRSFEIMDMAANTLGACLALALWTKLDFSLFKLIRIRR